MTKISIPSVPFDASYVCEECEGEGTIRIYNAYEPGAYDIVPCDYCGGDGLFFPRGQKNPTKWN